MKREKSSSSLLPASEASLRPDFAGRYRRLWLELEKRGVDDFLITHAPNLFYLFNIEPSAGYALCTPSGADLVLDGRYIEDAEARAVNCRPLKAKRSLESALRSLLRKRISGGGASERRLGVESRHVSMSLARLLESWQTGYRIVPCEEAVEELRTIKEPAELACLQAAFDVAQKAFSAVRHQVAAGMTELEVAGLLELEFRRCGAEQTAFETIVASGARASMPHARASRKKIAAGEAILVDFGVRLDGYCSDLTRIILPPGASRPWFYDVVKEAQNSALAAVAPGVKTTVVDAAAREVIARAGLGEHFVHSTGHGLGLEVHEAPIVSWRRPRLLKEGMVVTIEPGVYLPGEGGVRLEDVVVITGKGSRLLSTPE